jgi:hypothetical protein
MTLRNLLQSTDLDKKPHPPSASLTIASLASPICLGVEQHEHLLATVRQRIEDPDLLRLLANILAASAQLDHSQPGLLAPLLADIAFESIDSILQQAQSLGREGNFLHTHCTRIANQIVILLDHDSRYDWILDAMRKRLREELSNLRYDLAAVESQSVDLTSGGSLRFLDFELRLVKGSQGKSRVRYRLLQETQHGQTNRTAPRRQKRYYPLHFLGSCINWIGRQCQVVQDAYRKAQSIQVGWRHLPITLFPILLFYFGWRSLAPWLCLAAIFIWNWQWAWLWCGRRECGRGDTKWLRCWASASLRPCSACILSLANCAPTCRAKRPSPRYQRVSIGANINARMSARPRRGAYSEY